MDLGCAGRAGQGEEPGQRRQPWGARRGPHGELRTRPLEENSSSVPGATARTLVGEAPSAAENYSGVPWASGFVP